MAELSMVYPCMDSWLLKSKPTISSVFSDLSRRFMVFDEVELRPVGRCAMEAKLEAGRPFSARAFFEIG